MDAMTEPESHGASTGLEGRDFLALTDLTREELHAVLDRAALMERGGGGGSLAGKTLAMVFRKSSTRTRVSFEAGMYQLGGHALFLSDRDTQMGRGESIPDTALVLSGYVDAIMIRTFEHDEVVELARHASVPVINGLTDLLHPCQLLADLLSVQQEFGRDFDGLEVAWIGDGNNVANSWINAAYRLGFEIRLACPDGYGPDDEILERARLKRCAALVDTPEEAARGAHVVTTDVWASMGQEAEKAARSEAFQGYAVSRELMRSARQEAIFLHCLPAHRGEEVDAAVIDGPRSRVFQEAENRLHAQKALLVELLSPSRTT